MFTKSTWVVRGAALLASLSVCTYFAHVSTKLLGQSHLWVAKKRPPLSRVWNRINHTSATLDLPPCRKTFLFAFGRTAGFGSSFGIFVRSGLWAREHGYELLVTTLDDWVYGDFEDYFHHPVLTCTPSQENYEPNSLVRVGSHRWQEQEHLLMVRGLHEHIDRWILERYIDLDLFQQIPVPDTHRVLPLGLTTPFPVYDAFRDLHEQFMRVWRPKPQLDGMVQAIIDLLDLGLPRGKRAPVIGMHYRGGDKLKKECPVDAGCGNITNYLSAALETRQTLPDTFCNGCKPILALMTIEPDAYELFMSNPLSDEFQIRLLPPPAVGLTGHAQGEFNRMDPSNIADSTMTMLRDITALAIHADGFIVTASSNVGRVAIMLGGPKKHVRSIDDIFSPTTKKLRAYAQEAERQHEPQRRKRFLRRLRWK